VVSKVSELSELSIVSIRLVGLVRVENVRNGGCEHLNLWVREHKHGWKREARGPGG
jgi:hypothetical protein